MRDLPGAGSRRAGCGAVAAGGRPGTAAGAHPARRLPRRDLGRQAAVGGRTRLGGPPGTAAAGVVPRMSACGSRAGIGPALLGIPADELRRPHARPRRGVAAAQARRLTEQVAADPAAALEAWVRRGWPRCELDPLGRPGARHGGGRLPVADDGRPAGARRRASCTAGACPLRLRARAGWPGCCAWTGRSTRPRAGAPLAQVAADCGYADQAHLSREVRALAGATPTGLLARATPRLARRTGRPACRRGRGRRRSACPRRRPTVPGGRGSRRAVSSAQAASTSAGLSQAKASATRWPPSGGGPVRVEGADGVLGVERHAQAAGVGVHVRLVVGVGGDVEAEPAVEGEGGGHVGDDQFDEGGAEVHAPDARQRRRPGSWTFRSGTPAAATR